MHTSAAAEDVLVSLLRRCYHAPTCRAIVRAQSSRSQSRLQFQPARRLFHDVRGTHEPLSAPSSGIAKSSGTASAYHSSPHVLQATTHSGRPSGPILHLPPKDIAVLGGGITGLACAYYLSQELPEAKITLYEGSERLGGWLRSRRVNVGDGEVVFEQGPRTLRPAPPAGLVTLALVKQIGLEDEVIMTAKTSAAARNRYVYFPDHLVRMPGPGQDFFEMTWGLLTETAFKGLIPGMLFEYTRAARSPTLEDESVGDFLRRRLGTSAIGDNIVSAVLHGIYAGDINQLSVRSLQPSLWQREVQHGSIAAAIWKSFPEKTTTMQYRDAILMSDLTSKPEGLAKPSEMNFASVYSFKKGIGQLADTIVQKLEENPNVELRTNSKITSLRYDGQTDYIQIEAENATTEAVDTASAPTYDQVISTISGVRLSALSDSKVPTLAKTHAVTVMVVNLYYRNPALLSVHGFGYLIPRSVPYDQNPECALGVVFDSDAVTGQDTVPGTKVTVMLGGHWWDDFDSYPDEEEGAQMAKAILKRHLKVEDEPAFVHAGLQYECIPQYTVGHEQRMAKAHHELMSAFKGKLAVAGNSYTGVGLNDCVRAARDVALDVAQYQGTGGITGLEQFMGERRWVKTVISKA